MPSKTRKPPQKRGKDVKGAFETAPCPNWPTLEPLVPTIDLNLDTLLKDQIIVIRNFFTSTLCKNYVSFLSDLPLVTTPTKPKGGDALRVNDRIQFDDYAFARQLWQNTGLPSLLNRPPPSDDRQATTKKSSSTSWGGEPCGLNPRIRIYRYTEGQFFAQHCKWTHSSHTVSTISAKVMYVSQY